MRIESSCIFGEEDKRHRKYLCVKLASYDIAGKFWDLSEPPPQQDFGFPSLLNISHLLPSAKSQGSQVKLREWDVIASPTDDVTKI